MKCVSVRLLSLVSISDKAYKATDFNGNSDIIPKSQVFGPDLEVTKCEAYWISEWILSKKNLTYGSKTAWVNRLGEVSPTIRVTHHTPSIREPIKRELKDLKK